MSNEYKALKELVYNYIVDAINSGSLSDDDKVSEKPICDALGVSRTPVREALIQLAGDGFLESKPRKGFFVKRVDIQGAIELFEIIAALDSRAAYLVCDKLTPADIDHLKFLRGSMQLAIENNMFSKYDELQLEFHDYYAQRCGNKKLVEYISHVNKHFMKREYSGVEHEKIRELLQTANDEHAQTIKLFEAKDKKGVQDYIRDVHWNNENAEYMTW